MSVCLRVCVCVCVFACAFVCGWFELLCSLYSKVREGGKKSLTFSIKITEKVKVFLSIRSLQCECTHSPDFQTEGKRPKKHATIYWERLIKKKEKKPKNC